jgi:hypothetical protein
MRFFCVCMSGHSDWPCMTIQQSDDLLFPIGSVCPCGTKYRAKYGVVVEIVAPGIDGILYFKAPVPDDHIIEMHAMMHEKQLKSVSTQAFYDAVLVCKPTITSLLVEKKDSFGQVIPNQWTFSSHADYKALPNLDWNQIFNMAGYVLPPKPPTKTEAKAASNAVWVAKFISDTVWGSYMRFFYICMSGHPDWPCMTIQQSGDPLFPIGSECPCGTKYRAKYGVVVELAVPGIDTFLYCKVPAPGDHINKMRAMMHEKQLKSVSAQELRDTVLLCKQTFTSLVVEKKDSFGQVIPNQWTFSSHADHKALPVLGWHHIFNMAGYVLPPKPPTNREAKAARTAAWAAEHEPAAKKQRVEGSSSASSRTPRTANRLL